MGQSDDRLCRPSLSKEECPALVKCGVPQAVLWDLLASIGLSYYSEPLVVSNWRNVTVDPFGSRDRGLFGSFPFIYFILFSCKRSLLFLFEINYWGLNYVCQHSEFEEIRLTGNVNFWTIRVSFRVLWTSAYKKKAYQNISFFYPLQSLY